MASESNPQRTTIPALKVPQWLSEWDHVECDPDAHRRKPEHCFYLFSIPARHLRALSGIYPRSTTQRTRGADDLGIQRRHEEARSAEIRQFIQYGFPWSSLGQRKRASEEFQDMRKPGWLPTAIVVNILRKNDTRLGKTVPSKDLVTVECSSDTKCLIHLPSEFSGSKWRPKALAPIEIIDGQHRLWAFSDQTLHGAFALPVVAFYGLDLSWQAYLFYTINIKPKKINASLAYDLYPLLRTEDWLEKFEGHVIYRETRAQELVDLLWSHPDSPWYHRINMLGEPGARGRMISQAAWVRSLLATYVRSWEGPRMRIGGLFGAPVGSHKLTVPWRRAEQAAFLITSGVALRDAVHNLAAPWAKVLRQQDESPSANEDLAFYGPKTLINQDQGVRAFLHVTNDLCFVRSDELGLGRWGTEDSSGDDDVNNEVVEAVHSLRRTPAGKFLKRMGERLATFDWRASDAPGLGEADRLLRAAFRGSGGYKELRRQLLFHLARENGEVGGAADEVISALGYN